MKKTIFLSILLLLLAFTGCTSQKEFNGLSLPFSSDTIKAIELIHHTGVPSKAQQKWITTSEDINYIHNILSCEILIRNGSVGQSEQTDTLYITLHCTDGTGYTIKFESFGVKKGIISSKDTPAFSYFTPADVCWIWGILAKDYEGHEISIEDDPYTTESPVAIGYDT